MKMDIIESLKKGSIGDTFDKIDSMRPHILGDILPATSTSGSSIGSSLKSLTGILSERPDIFKSRLSSIQTAPTIVDKIKSAVTPPGYRAPASGNIGGYVNKDIDMPDIPVDSYSKPYEHVPSDIQFY